MNLRFLRTFVTIAEHPTFVSAAQALGLSHSAVSLQIKALEDELALTLVDRSKRPPALTVDGLALVELAQRMLAVADDIRSIGQRSGLVGRVTIGVVPSAMIWLLPPSLAKLSRDHPDLVVNIRSGLSSDLAQALRTREIDMAIATAPRVPYPGITSWTICDEVLDVVVPASMAATTDVEALAHRFIWFNRRALAGQLIEEELAKRRIIVRSEIEVDSIEAVEALVAAGLGVSITPRRPNMAPNPDLVRIPFGRPHCKRTLAMMVRERAVGRQIAERLLDCFRDVSRSAN